MSEHKVVKQQSTSAAPCGKCPVDPRTERTRTAVIQAAVQLLMTEGPSSVTHAHVAHAANISRTTAYKHCPTRADLLRATIEAIHTTTPQMDGLTGDIRADLRSFFSDIVRDLGDNQRAPLMAIMMERSQHDPVVAAVRNDLLAEFEPAFRTVLEGAIDADQLRRDVDIDLALASIFGSLLFSKFMSATPFNSSTAEKVFDEWVAAHRPD